MPGERSSSKHWVRHLPAVVWMALIFGLSSQQEFPSPGGLSLELQAVVAHLALFGTLALLITFAFDHLQHSTLEFDSLVIVVVTLYGISDEIHQSFVPGRSTTFFDVIVDCLGAILALVALRRFREWRRV